jgi:PKD repeat protein
MHVRPSRVALAIVSVAAIVGLSSAAVAVTGTSQPNIVSATPSTHTPNINDGITEAITQVGSKIIVGGSFSSVNPPGDTNTAHAVTRHYILAFDQATGVVDTAFVPTLDGEVEALIPGPTANTVYVGGLFNNVNGVKEKGVALLNTLTGATVTTFKPAAMNGVVYSMVNTNGHLILGGTFTTLAGVTHDGVGSLDANTGAVQSYISTQLTGHHNYNGTSGANGAVGPRALDISPNGQLLVVIGNFKNADGALHDQIAEINLGSTSASLNTSWNTSGYTAACASGAFDTYMRDISFSPDGTYFTIAATGGGTTTKNTDGTRSLCDTITRWETNASGTNVQPTWIDYSGNDSFLSIVATGTAIYAGGHQRWVNNSAGSDSAAEGSVPRPGLVALDPVNGMPFSWNPGRNPRGSGAWALYATSQGLYMGSDTTKIGAGATFTNRSRIAFFPLAGGEQVSAFTPPTLPANIFMAGPTVGGSVLQERPFTGTSAGATTTVNTATVPWSTVRGAFMVGNSLFYGLSDGNLYRTTFDGATVGAPSLVDPYDDPVWDNEDTGSGQTYRGVKASLYGTEMQNVTGMVYSNGKLYYSTNGSSQLHYRYFEADDGVVGSVEFTTAGTVNFSAIQGMFLSGSTLYYASSNGNLHAVAWNGGNASSSTDTVVSGPGVDGNDWRSHGMFGLPKAVNPPPTASFTSSCTALSCSFDASASTAPGSTITSYAWSFGDGANGTGETSSHTYGTGGTYTVSLTVTNADGNSTTTTQQVSPAAAAAPIAFVGSSSVNGNKSSLSVTVPSNVATGDGMLLFASVANAVPITAPAGWTLVGQTPSSLTSITTAIYRKVATSGDAGSTVAVGFTGTPHETVQLLAYSGTSTSNPVLTSSNNSVAGGTSLTSPTVSIGAGGTWVVSYWSAKSSAVNAWTVPGSQTTRDADNGSGSGRINSVVADSGSAVSAGSAGGITATTDGAIGGADSWTIVLTP